MVKINFQNNITKCNADTFNTMQDNIEDAIPTIDSAVSTSSTNGIENQAITNYVKGRLDKITIDLSNYVNSSTVSAVGVCKLEIKDNRVLLTSNLKVVPPYNTDTNYTQFTIPEAYRPSSQINVFAYSDSYKTWGRFFINTDGTAVYKPLVNNIPSGGNDWVKTQCLWDLD